MGYPEQGATLASSLTCVHGNLAQGAPSSPVLSNICFSDTDLELENLAKKLNIRLTRYADDVVFSGNIAPPSDLEKQVEAVFVNTPWRIAESKTLLQRRPGALKVHGLLLGASLRLSKNYRNQLRAYKHVLKKTRDPIEGQDRLEGHIGYSEHVSQVVNRLELQKRNQPSND